MIIFGLSIFILALIALGWYFQRGRFHNARCEQVAGDPATQAADLPILSHNADGPTQLVIGEHANHPVITIEACRSVTEYETGYPVTLETEPMRRLSCLLQAAPPLLVATQMSGRRLMEVVVHGELVRAADGNGYRAFVRGGRAIRENARLFDATNLNNVVNAAAIWQVASVLVAQKHLADISEKLDQIKTAIEKVSEFLDDQRRARITSISRYVQQGYAAISNGEFSSSVRNQLESCEKELLEIEDHLFAECRKTLEGPVTIDKWGTRNQTDDLTRRVDSLKKVFGDIALCLRTRIAAWHLVSLYPGEVSLKAARRDSIQRGIDELKRLDVAVDGFFVVETGKIESKVQFEWTVLTNRINVLEGVGQTIKSLRKSITEAENGLMQVSKVLVERDRPMRLLVEIENGVVVGARHARSTM